MERKIGDTFEFEGKKLQVKESAYNNCDGCFFDGKCFSIAKVGDCGAESRSDEKSVIFVEVQEQPQKRVAEREFLTIEEIKKVMRLRYLTGSLKKELIKYGNKYFESYKSS